MAKMKDLFLRRFSVLMTVWLLIVWIPLFGEFTPLVVISGIIVVLAIELIFPLPHAQFFRVVRPKHAVVLAAVFLKDMVEAALAVARVVITGRPYQCAIVRVDLRSREDITMAITGAMINLVPGTIVVETRRTEGVIYLHVFDIENQGGPEGVRKAALEQEERVLKTICSRESLDNLGVEL